MNKAFLDDLKKEVNVDLNAIQIDHPVAWVQLYIAAKLWSIEQLLKHQGGR